MSKPPAVSGREVLKILLKIGFYKHHRKGSHVTLKRDLPLARVTVPDTPKDLGKGIFRRILKDAGISLDEFLQLR